MKKFASLALLAALLMAGTTVSAQKIAIINTQDLIALMPELDSVQIKMTKYQNELRAQLEEIQVEYNNKLNDYQTNLAKYNDITRQLKEKELQDLQARFSNFRDMANDDVMKMQQTLMAPVIDRAEKSIKKVAKEGGYLFVFDDAVGATIYTDETKVTDILPLVKKDLGIPADAKPRGAADAAPAPAGARR